MNWKKLLVLASLLLFFFTGTIGFAEVDYEKMPIAELQKKAEAGDSDAQYWLGKAYSDGKGISKDFGKEIEAL